MPNNTPPAKTIKPLLLFFASTFTIGWLGQLLAADELAKKLGAGKGILQVLIDMGKSVLSGKFTDALKKLGKEPLAHSNQLAKSIVVAFTRSMEIIRTEYIASYEVTDPQTLEDLAFFTGHLFDVFNDEQEINEDFLPANAQLKAEDFLRFFFASKKLSYPRGLTAQEIEDLKTFFIEGFKRHFPAFFLEELQLNEHSKTEYFKYLLELTVTSIEDIRTSLADLNKIAVRTNVVLETLGQQYREEIAERSEQLIGLITRQLEPKLDSNILPAEWDLTHQNRLHYKTQYTTFIGREPETSALWDFLDTNRRFAWWTVTGPGGAGKSRLAQEFCILARNNGYNAGFYDLLPKDVDELRLWEQWEFSFPSLLVIDYALAKQAKIAKLIEVLVKKSLRNGCPSIRLLLLDREVSREWEETVDSQPELSISRYNESSLALTELDDQHLYGIVRQVLAGNQTEISYSQQEIIDKLTTLDPLKRPLYAFFMAVALAEGHEIRHWNVDNLLNYHLLRLENRIWKQQPGYAANSLQLKRLLLANTITQALDIKELKQLNSVLNKADDSIIDLYGQLSDTKKDKTGRIEEWLGVLPDIQGEYFILKELDALLHHVDPEEGRSQALKLLAAAWATKAENASFMSWLCWDDFREIFKEATDLLIDPTLLRSLSPTAITAICSLYLHITASADVTTGVTEDASMAYDRLKQLAIEKDLLTCWRYVAAAASSLCLVLSQQKQQDEKVEKMANELFEDVKTQTSEFHDWGSRLWMAQALTARIKMLVKKDNTRATALSYYARLVDLTTGSNEQGLWIPTTKAAAYIAEVVLPLPKRKKNWPLVWTIYQKLDQLTTQAEPLPVDLSMTKAELGLVLIYYWRAQPDWRKGSLTVYQMIKDMDPEGYFPPLSIKKAQAAFYLIDKADVVDHWEDSILPIYQDVETLAADKNNPEMLPVLVASTLNLMNALRKKEKHQGLLWPYYQKIKGAVTENATQETLHTQAKAALVALTDMAIVEKAGIRTWEAYEDLKQLAIRMNRPEIWSMLAVGFSFLVINSVPADRQAEKILQAYHYLQSIPDWRENADARYLIVGTIRALIPDWVQEKRLWPKVMTLVEDLRGLLPTVEISDRPELLAEVSTAITNAWSQDEEWKDKIPSTAL